jgi:hypothetical protein
MTLAAGESLITAETVLAVHPAYFATSFRVTSPVVRPLASFCVILFSFP